MTRNRVVVNTVQLIGAVIFAAFLAVLAISHVDLRWVIGVGNTIMIFGLAWYYSRSRSRTKWYWVSFVGILVVHCAALLAIHTEGGRIPLLYYMLFSPIEAAAIYWVLLKVTE